jgi:protein TonB
MEIKKAEKVDLDKKKDLFFQIGLLVSLMIVFFVFESKSSPSVENSGMGEAVKQVVEMEIVPITRQEEVKPIAPPVAAPSITDILTIESDDVQLSTDFSINVEATETTVVEPVVFTSTAKKEEVVEEEEIFISVEEMPTFQGKESSAFRDWINDKLLYPPVAVENGVSGRVIIQFAVNSRGEVVDVQVLRGVDPNLDKEAVRVISSCPKGFWKPGVQAGKPVKVQFTFPVVFVLQ